MPASILCRSLAFTSACLLINTIGMLPISAAAADDHHADADKGSAVEHATTAEPATPSPAEQWLDRFEARAASIESLQARIRYDKILGLQGDTQSRFGNLTYLPSPPPPSPPASQAGEVDETGGDDDQMVTGGDANDNVTNSDKSETQNAYQPTRFHVQFNTIRYAGQQPRPIDHAFIFDGHWLAERVVDNDANEKRFTRYELVPPHDPSKPQDEELFDLGKGPLALPLNLKKAEVMHRFFVTVKALPERTPKHLQNTVHLRLTPKPGLRIEHDQLDLWFDKDTLLPTQVTTLDDMESGDETIIRFIHYKPNPTIDETVFNTTPPTGEAAKDWQIIIRPLENPSLPPTSP